MCDMLVYLTLVSACVWKSDVFDGEGPLVAILRMVNRKPLIFGVAEVARCEYVPVLASHPRNLEVKFTIFCLLVICEKIKNECITGVDNYTSINYGDDFKFSHTDIDRILIDFLMKINRINAALVFALHVLMIKRYEYLIMTFEYE